MNDIIMNCKSKNGEQTSVLSSKVNVYISSFIFEGFATPVQTIAPVSPSKKQLSPDHPNPALPITEVRHDLTDSLTPKSRLISQRNVLPRCS